MITLGAKSLFDLSDKRVLVTGAAGHLGRYMCEVLNDNGAHVIGVGRSGELPDSISSCASEYYQIDLNDAGDLEELFLACPSVDILVNNAHPMSASAGFNIIGDHISGYDSREWDENMSSLRWAVKLTSVYGRRMAYRQRGSIINISTMYAQVSPHPLLYHETQYMNPPGYGASKAALLAFTRYVAAFWGKYNVRCNAILPGPFPKAITTENGELIKRLCDRTCLGRTGRPEELAGLVLYLASDASSYVTGQAISVDGGWSVT